ncbi:MAG: response regulator [Desulfovibrio sp.]|nr:response regulator [Desulfovibrio sp.]
MLTVVPAVLAAGFAAARLIRPALRRALEAAEAYACGDFTAEARADGLVREGAELIAAINAVGESARKQAAEQAGARREDDAADKALNGLLAGLSHDVRHPLNRVVGAAYLALRCRLDDGRRGCFENIYAAGIRLQKITGAVMELSRLNAGKLCAPRKPVSEAEIIAEIRRHLSLANAFPGAREGASGSCPEQHGAGGGDSPTDAGWRSNSFECKAPTFSKNRQNLIFQKLASGNLASAAPLRFLTKAKRYEIEDSPPRRALLAGWVGGHAPAVSPGMPKSVSGPHPEQTAQESAGDCGLPELFPETAALLEDAGFSAACVEDAGAAGIVTAQACAVGEPFDLLLLDRHMPDAADMETLRDICNNPSIRPRPLILMLAAYGCENIRRQAEEAGADAFLRKPIRASALRAAVETLAAARTPGEQSGRQPHV